MLAHCVQERGIPANHPISLGLVAVRLFVALQLDKRPQDTGIGAMRNLGTALRAIEQTVRNAGLPISRSRSILPLRQALLEAERAGSAVRFVPKGATINSTRLPESLTSQKRAFSYRVRLAGIDGLGNAIQRHITIATDRATITPGEIESAAEQAVAAEGQSDTLVEVEATLEYGQRRARPT